MQILTQQISPSDFAVKAIPGMVPLFSYDAAQPFSIPLRVFKNWSTSQSHVKRGLMSADLADHHLEEGLYASLRMLHTSRPYLLLGLKETMPAITLCHDVSEVLLPCKRAFERVLGHL